MKRVLVTGASGFVGSNLARRLLHHGYEVNLLLRSGFKRWRLEDMLPDCRIVSGSLSDADSLVRAVNATRPEWVFHLAAYGAYPDEQGFAEMMGTNVLGCAALMDACVRAGTEVFIQSGSSSEYGYKNHAPSESELAEPNSHYAISKAAATHYCQLTARTTDLRASTIRLYSVYGPYEEPSRFIPTLLLHSLNQKLPPLVSPETSRDFVYVDDAVRGLIAAAEVKSYASGAIYNLASGTQTTITSVVEIVRALLNVNIEPSWGKMKARQWDTNIWVGDPTAIRRDLGWAPDVALREGLVKTLDWLNSNPQVMNFYKAAIFTEDRSSST